MTDTLDPRLAPRLRRNAVALLPAAVLAALVLVLVAGAPPVLLLVAGAGGWLLALALRQPVALLAARRLPRERAATALGWFSGPAEELVRVLLVLLLIRSLEDALWAGFGWAAIEVLLVAVNTFAVASLVTRDDEKSREARELLAAQGMMTPHSPGWGFLERLSAIALHLGFTLALVAAPWLVVLAIPVHSAVNMLAVRFAKTHIALTELGLLLAGAAVLAGGLALAVAAG